MRQSLETVADLLRQQLDILANLTRLSHEMRTIMVSADMESFGGLVRQERAELRKMKAAQKELAALLPEVSIEFGLEDGESTLGKIISHATSEERATIQPLQKVLKKELHEFAELSDATHEVVDLYLEYSDIMMSFVAPEEDPLNNLYGGDGNAAPERMKAGLFDSKA